MHLNEQVIRSTQSPVELYLERQEALVGIYKMTTYAEKSILALLN